MVVIDVVIIDLFILVMYVHMIHHHHALPSVYENHRIHPLHLRCCTLIITSSCGDLLLSYFIYYNSFFSFCDEPLV